MFTFLRKTILERRDLINRCSAIKPCSIFIRSLSTNSTNQNSFTFSPNSTNPINSSKQVQFETTRTQDPVLHSFRNNGFPNTHISTTIKDNTSLLLSNVDETRKPKFDFLNSMGLSGMGKSSWERRKVIKPDLVHLLLKRNNTFVTVTDAKGNRKVGCSTGCLKELKRGSQRYTAKATAEHVGRLAGKIGLNSVAMKVKGATFFKRKKAVMLSWREGYTFDESEGMKGTSEMKDTSKIIYVSDVTKQPHNGCRLPKKVRK